MKNSHRYTKLVIFSGISFTDDVIGKKIGDYELKKADIMDSDELEYDHSVYYYIKDKVYDPIKKIRCIPSYFYYFEKGIDSYDEERISDLDDTTLILSLNLQNFNDFVLDAILIVDNKSKIHTKPYIKSYMHVSHIYHVQNYKFEICNNNIDNSQKLYDTISTTIENNESKKKWLFAYFESICMESMIPLFIYKMAVVESCIEYKTQKTKHLSKLIGVMVGGLNKEKSIQYCEKFKRLYEKRGDFLHQFKDEITIDDYIELSEYLRFIALIIINPDYDMSELYSTCDKEFGTFTYNPLIKWIQYAK